MQKIDHFNVKLQRRLKIEELDDYAAAASIAEEVLSGIRTVFAFSGEKIEAERYSKQLSPAKPASRRRGLLYGVENAALRFFLFTTAALIFWFGARWVLDDRGNVDKEYTAAVLMIVSSLSLIQFVSPFIFVMLPTFLMLLRYSLA